MNKSKELLIGAHTSIAGGVHNALYEGQSLGANTVQIFTANQKRWEGKPLSQKDIELWEKAKDETGIKTVMSHDSYLINLGSPNQEILEKSLNTFAQEIHRCHALNIDFLNFHPGSATTSTEQECLDQIVKSLKSLAPLVQRGKTRLLLEATAGQGSSVGHRFEHLAYILQGVKNELAIGVCIDTCHIFSAGYDIRTKQDWERTLKQFDEIVGLEHLYALHVNDSKNKLGAKLDRHASLGTGQMGLACFQAMMELDALKHIPKYLETPEGDAKWKFEIELLRDFASEPREILP